jgi:hypothetical protein
MEASGLRENEESKGELGDERAELCALKAPSPLRERLVECFYK